MADQIAANSEEPTSVDPRLQDIVERLFRSCYRNEDYKPAIGIAIEARRLDVVEEGIMLAGRRGSNSKGKSLSSDGEGKKDLAVELMEYVLHIAMGEVQEIGLRERVRSCSVDRMDRLPLTSIIAPASSGQALPGSSFTRLLFHQQVRHTSERHGTGGEDSVRPGTEGRLKVIACGIPDRL